MKFNSLGFYIFLLIFGLITHFAIFPKFILGDSLSISGNPPTFTISSTVAGFQPSSISNSTTTYSMTSLLVSRSILGSLNTVKTGIIVQVNLPAPSSGGTSAGLTTLTTSNQTLVSGIPILSIASGGAITYVFTASLNAAIGTSTEVMTLTVQ